MPKVTINGRTVEVEAGTNLVDAAIKVGVQIPHYCYHPRLSVVGQCRMCLVKVDKMPKLRRPGEIMGEITSRAAAETGLSHGTLVVAGGGDGQCAGTGTNVLEPGRAYANLGTAIVSGNFSSTYATGKAFRTMTAVAEEGYIYEPKS